MKQSSVNVLWCKVAVWQPEILSTVKGWLIFPVSIAPTIAFWWTSDWHSWSTLKRADFSFFLFVFFKEVGEVGAGEFSQSVCPFGLVVCWLTTRHLYCGSKGFDIMGVKPRGWLAPSWKIRRISRRFRFAFSPQSNDDGDGNQNVKKQ